MAIEQTRTLRLVVATLTRRMIAAGLGSHCLRTIHFFLTLPRTAYKGADDGGREVEYSMRALVRLGLVSRQKAVDEARNVRWLYDYTAEGLALFLPPAKAGEQPASLLDQARLAEPPARTKKGYSVP